MSIRCTVLLPSWQRDARSDNCQPNCPRVEISRSSPIARSILCVPLREPVFAFSPTGSQLNRLFFPFHRVPLHSVTP